jgi:hypothetical protein
MTQTIHFMMRKTECPQTQDVVKPHLKIANYWFLITDYQLPIRFRLDLAQKFETVAVLWQK